MAEADSDDGTAEESAGRPSLVERARRWTDGTVVDDLLQEIVRTRPFDLSYTIAAQAFVALIPLILVLGAGIVGGGDQEVVAAQVIQRLGLVGAAKAAVESLFRNPAGAQGVYWLGLLITLYSAFALSRRVGRAYTTIWGVPRLPPKQQWRGMVWVLLQVTLVFLAAFLRDLAHTRGSVVLVLAIAGLLLLWGGGEYVAQLLLTHGAVERWRIAVAAGLVSVGRAGLLVWGALYLPRSITGQAEHYGPIGVVFGFFTWLFLAAGVLVVATMLAAVFTARPVDDWFRRVPAPA